MNNTSSPKYDYYPFGLLMPGRSTTSGNTIEKFTGYELDADVGLNLYYAVARSYDPALARFLQVDPLFDESSQVGWTPYHYTLNNPLNRIDPTGLLSTIVEENEDGTYTVVGGDPNDGDTSIYVGSKDGEKIGESVTTHSFFDANGKAVVGAEIDLDSTEGQDFLDEEIIEGDPGVSSALDFQHGGDLDFKTRGETENMTSQQRKTHRYIGSKTSNGKVASARDFGNMAAGIVAGRAGLNLKQTRALFDLYQGGPEPSVSAKAQNIGWRIGIYLRLTKDN